jgi:UPF0755 protein
MVRLMVVLGAILLLLVGGTATVVSQRLAPAAPEAPEVVFSVEPGDPLSRVARRLAAEGLVRDARAFEWLARWRGVARSLHAGEYRLRASQASAEILERLTDGRVATYEVVVPEGFSAVQIAERLQETGLTDAEAFRAVVEDADLASELGVPAPRLEGYLYPETYRLPRGLSRSTRS